ncbi:MAG: hypothetical protein J1F05_08235 [Muribaculaceae bacterium]|nr:hypothetical protein [Muribaculaceae bacterium]
MPRLLLVIILAFAVYSCSDNDSRRATPKRHAFPRIEAYDSGDVSIDLGQLNFSVSADANIKPAGEQWLDISYPRYGTTLHLSALRLDCDSEKNKAMANRRQRISLNIGDAKARADVFTNDYSFDCEMVVCNEAVTTPVQFFATDAGGNMLSGAFVIHGTTTPADSMQAVVKILESEAFTILKSLKSAQ